MHFRSTQHLCESNAIYFVADSWDLIPEFLRERFRPIAIEEMTWENNQAIQLHIESNGYALGSKREIGHGKYKLGPCYF